LRHQRVLNNTKIKWKRNSPESCTIQSCYIQTR